MSIIPSNDEYQIIHKICSNALTSQLLPKGMTLAAAMTISLKGREISIPPLMALSEISIINGKPTLSSILMLALVRKAYPQIKLKYEQTDEYCKVSVFESQESGWQTFGFSLDDAQRAGLLQKPGPWKQYPRAMMRSRAVSEMCRSLFPDALMGASYTPEELGGEEKPESHEIENEVIVEKVEKVVLKEEKSAINPKVQEILQRIAPKYGSQAQPAEPTLTDLTAAKDMSVPQATFDFNAKLNTAEVKMIFGKAKDLGLSNEELKELIWKECGVERTFDIKSSQLENLLNAIVNRAKLFNPLHIEEDVP